MSVLPWPNIKVALTVRSQHGCAGKGATTGVFTMVKLQFITDCLVSTGSERGFHFVTGPSTQLLATTSQVLHFPLDRTLCRYVFPTLPTATCFHDHATRLTSLLPHTPSCRWHLSLLCWHHRCSPLLQPHRLSLEFIPISNTFATGYPLRMSFLPSSWLHVIPLLSSHPHMG